MPSDPKVGAKGGNGEKAPPPGVTVSHVPSKSHPSEPNSAAHKVQTKSHPPKPTSASPLSRIGFLLGGGRPTSASMALPSIGNLPIRPLRLTRQLSWPIRTHLFREPVAAEFPEFPTQCDFRNDMVHRAALESAGHSRAIHQRLGRKGITNRTSRSPARYNFLIAGEA